MDRKCNGVVVEPFDSNTSRYSASALVGRGSSVPRSPMIDLVHIPRDGWQDQYDTESCCGAAIKQAVHIRQGMIGIPIDEIITPAELDIYYRGRASRVGWKNVVDIGANPVACWETLRPPKRLSGSSVGLGIVTYEDLPFDPDKVDVAPDPAIYRKSIDRDWLEYRWILESGSSRLVQLDALLRTGHPVTAGVTCDRSIMTWNPSQGPWRYTGPWRGIHYLCFIHVDDEGHYWAVGSWGHLYGMGGLHRIARDEMASDRVVYLATPEIRLR